MEDSFLKGFDLKATQEKEQKITAEKRKKYFQDLGSDYSEQSTPLIPTQSTPVNFIKNFLDFPLDSY